jgi:predicted metal-dependent hydrolase
MLTSSHQINVNGITVDVVRKKIKNLHLAVYPPDGRVRVAVPLRIHDDAVRMAVITRLSWIKDKQAKFQGQVRQSERDYISGESHYFMGQRYLLDVIVVNSKPRVMIKNNTTLEMHVLPTMTREQREQLLYAWYRTSLKNILPAMIEKWEGVIGESVKSWGIKRMKTRWGTCNPTARRIWLNLELAKKPLHCLEYVVVHEIVHLLERTHNDRFKGFMSSFMPQWRHYRAELNALPLAHETWE